MMSYITSLLVALIAFAHLVQSAPSVGTILLDNSDNNTISGGNATYNLVEIVWDVTINDTATPYNFTATGTIENALTKMAVFDPVGAAAINASVLGNTTSRSLDLAVPPREDYFPTTRICDGVAGGGLASGYRIKQGIQYLGTVTGKPAQGPGPGSCGRVSCSFGAAIYWCNDNLDDKILRNYLAIADGAQLVLDYCERPNGGGVNGQQFFQDGWNVIVRYDSC